MPYLQDWSWFSEPDVGDTLRERDIASPIQRMLNSQVILVKRARGIPAADNFALVQSPMPVCPPGGILVRNIALSVDAGMRGWVSEEAGYASVPVDTVMRSYAIGEVLESNCTAHRVGDTVFGLFNWQQYCGAGAEAALWKVDLQLAPASTWLGALGISGLAAWVGLTDFASHAPGETILVSTAAGGVGSIVGQLARRRGLKPIGLAGRDAKVVACTAEFGYDAAINYRRPDFASALEALTPAGIDLFFDNTGGEIADVVFSRLNPRARIIQCGTAAISSWAETPRGPRREREVLIKELSWKGFIVLKHLRRAPAAHAELTQLIADGQLRLREHVLEGLASAPGALALLYAGDNEGRLSIRL